MIYSIATFENNAALINVTQLVDSHPLHQKVMVQPPVRAHTQVEGSIPSWGVYGRQPSKVFLSH